MACYNAAVCMSKESRDLNDETFGERTSIRADLSCLTGRSDTSVQISTDLAMECR